MSFEIGENCRWIGVSDRRIFLIISWTFYYRILRSRNADWFLLQKCCCSKNAYDSCAINIREWCSREMQEKHGIVALLNVLRLRIKELIWFEMICITKCQGWRRRDCFRREWLVKGEALDRRTSVDLAYFVENYQVLNTRLWLRFHNKRKFTKRFQSFYKYFCKIMRLVYIFIILIKRLL